MTLGTVPSSDVDEAMKGKKNRNQQSLRPWHRRPWFWIILAIILALLAVGATNAAVFLTRKDPSTTGTLKVGADGTTLCVLDANNPSVGVGTCSPDRSVTVKGLSAREGESGAPIPIQICAYGIFLSFPQVVHQSWLAFQQKIPMWASPSPSMECPSLRVCFQRW